MSKYLIILILCLFRISAHAQEEGENRPKGTISGKLTEENPEEPALGAQLFVYAQDNTSIVGSANTNDDSTNQGKYLTNRIDTGMYNIRIKFAGHLLTIINNIPVRYNQNTVVNLKLFLQAPGQAEDTTINYAVIAPKLLPAKPNGEKERAKEDKKKKRKDG
ncbi:MAG: carboxypeptidase regulatory-like domain-containing protein [Taibaiella sp.]|nr:carboxypeptidase regulatory-like domain-containing protein [Taibaiella sp.]